MSILPKGAPSLRILALPLARIKIAKRKPFHLNGNGLLVFYHFDLILTHAERSDLAWHKKVLKNAVNNATDIWTGLGKAQKGSWKLWTYELGERMADKIDFEEVALRNVDPSLGPIIPSGASAGQGSDTKKGWSQKIPLVYPPSLYPAGVDQSLQPPLTHLRSLLASRIPQHRWGFCSWMLIAPLTIPIALIPIIPNLPFFFCVWRSWSHYRAYRSSKYLSSLLDCGLIEPEPSLDLDKLYASLTPPRGSVPSASGSSGNILTFGESVVDRKSEAASGTGTTCPECILLAREAMPRILELFHLSASTMDVYRAVNQAHARLEKSMKAPR